MGMYGEVGAQMKWTYDVGVWKYIRKGWDDFLGNCRFEVERGTRTKFWHDYWCGDMILKNAFPSLYRIALDQGCSVADNMCINSDSITWSVSFTRAVQDWEMGDITEFYRVLYSLKLRARREDKLLWTSTGNKKFSVRSYHKALLTHSSNAFPWKSIWRSNVLLKVLFFGWVASHSEILIIDKLKSVDFT
ncbi:hypothetical protein I3842_03G250200 [Carya illinoinensis]|uniref:Reverse transcriptase zinc-binding domain-containing protein n=2 Tax=Carya illinoinensis TaxID=32201 RepID=A0A922FL45_CARIL|nr:hypothetical protein I3842_03G250200 [Carya illinoinensis]